jgi:hypothetical protein
VQCLASSTTSPILIFLQPVASSQPSRRACHLSSPPGAKIARTALDARCYPSLPPPVKPSLLQSPVDVSATSRSNL